MGQVLAAQHADRVSVVEAQQMNYSQRAALSDDDEADILEARQLDRQLEQQQVGQMAVMETTVFGMQLFKHTLMVGHFLHIWSLAGVRFTLGDGLLALHLHSALSSASKTIAE